MKRSLGFIVLSLLLAAPVASFAQSNSTTLFGDVKQTGKNAIVLAGSNTTQQIKDFSKTAEMQFHGLAKKLNELKEKAKTETGEAKANLDKKIADVQKKLDDLEPKLKELETATTNTFSQVRSAFENGVRDVRKAMQ